MAKKETSGKRKLFLLKQLPIRKLKAKVKSYAHDPDKSLRDTQLIIAALLQCLWEGDIRAFKEILRSYYEAINTAATLRKIGLSKRTFYEAISNNGNPSLDTISKIIQGLKLAIMTNPACFWFPHLN